MPDTDRVKTALAERYGIERELGSGGMATVYLARDLKHDREVALKVLRSDLSAVIGTERFLAEVRITARLDHPHILTLIDSGEAAGVLYYVLPYVRGESLRAKLTREKQLGVDDALSIVKQIASALDYAHSHGVVHRDIKPENILLHEGEAVLADFGIALAVKEAGGNRLTETGLSLGTPQYMSPEQATGDRALDKRSDIYSLGAVYYEMITGEPPVTGATAQAMIAKLLTEKPVRMRVVRPTITGAIERATEKALAKVPADRFSSAGEFARALSSVDAEERVSVSRNNGNAKWIVGGVVAAAIAAAGFYMAGHGSAASPAAAATLRDPVQLTNSGNVAIAAISDDGKALAYVVNDCSSIGCRYAVDLKDVGGTATRRILQGATAIYRLEISPDRRNLVLLGSVNGVYGSWLLSLLGGPPRLIVPGIASFFAEGDSLVFTRVGNAGRKYWVYMAGLDGVIADSIQMDGPLDNTPFVTAVPGSSRFAQQVYHDGVLRFEITERDGKRVSMMEAPRGADGGMTVSRDALWLLLLPPAGARNIVRVPFDPETMKLISRGDTVYSGNTQSLSVTADGTTVVYDDGATDYSGWLMPLADLVGNRFTDDKRVTRATGSLRGSVSPDGSMSVIGRDASQSGREFAVIKTGVPGEIPIPGRHNNATPEDSTLIKMADLSDSSTQLYLYDYRTRRKSSVLNVNSVGFRDNTRAGDAWLWIPAAGKVIYVQRDGETRPRRINLPKWYKDVFWISGSSDGTKVAIMGYQAPNEDSLGVAIVSLVDGSSRQVYSTFGEGGGTSWMADGSLVASINDTPESETLFHLKDGQPPRKLGSTPRLISGNTVVRVTSDMKKAFVVTRDDRRDAWMSKVVR